MQFNLGFIICKLGSDVFIVDQVKFIMRLSYTVVVPLNSEIVVNCIGVC